MVTTTAQKDFRHVRKATVLRDSTGDTLRVGGYRPDKKSRNPQKFSASHDSDQELPAIVDLRPFMTPVENQRNSNSCTANAMAGAYEYLDNRINGEATDVSRLFIYYNARALDGRTRHDEGTYLSHCVKVVRKYGACSEETWPFTLRKIKAKPPKSAYQEAVRFRIEDAAAVEVDLDTMRSCLAEGYPFVFGLQLFESFNGAGGNGGLVSMPDPDNEKHNGGHAMLCVGYSDPDRVFIIRNSWGEEWGDEGYCYVPYDYMADPNFNHDCWVIRQVRDRDINLRQDIRKSQSSLFDPKRSEMVSSLRVPGRTHTPSGIPLYNESYHVQYEKELVYLDDCETYVSVDEVEDLESLYYLEYEEEYEEETIESWYEETEYLDEDSEEFEEDSEEDESEDESEDSYEEDEEEDVEDDEEYEEDDEEYEEDDEEYEEDDEEYEEDESYEEEEEETEDSYEEDGEDEEEEDIEEESYEEEESEEEGDYEEGSEDE
jgi:C1A family cysteine protease